MPGPMDNALRWIKHDPGADWIWRILAPPVAAFLLLRSTLHTRSSRVMVEGPGANYSGAAIYVNWHQHLPFLCIHHGQHRRCLLMSSSPYMQTIAQWCRWLGLTVVRGAPGERTRQSMARLLEPLRRGQSVIFAVDGPAGPAFQAKPGCVELARSAGVPIIPVAYWSRKGKRNMARWDQMYNTGMFDEIVVHCGAPIRIAPGEADADVLARVQSGLDEVCSGARGHAVKA
ncbi:MAG TPA: DUF374 domain-containing protein [Candidatus Angelobacter sp.]|nr:DUF374 domain-containing protein [Candidatus Angelobacter sp.]